MFTEGQTIKITAVEGSVWRKLVGNRAIAATIIEIDEYETYVEVSDEDAKALGLRGGNGLNIQTKSHSRLPFTMDWTLEEIATELPAAEDVYGMDVAQFTPVQTKSGYAVRRGQSIVHVPTLDAANAVVAGAVRQQEYEKAQIAEFEAMRVEAEAEAGDWTLEDLDNAVAEYEKRTGRKV